jgi:hypothetical protein
MAMLPQPKKKKRPAPAGPKQNTMKPRKSTSTGSPLNKPMPVKTGGVAGGPSAPTRRSKPAGGYAKNKAKPAGYAKSPTKAKGTRPGAKPVTAAQRAYAQQQTAKSAIRAQAAKKKQPVLKGIPNIGKRPKPGTGTAPPKYQPLPVRKPKPKTAKLTPGRIAMSEKARKAIAAKKAAEVRKAARVKRTGESLATTPAQVRARKEAAGKAASALARKRRAPSGYAKRPSKALSPTELRRRAVAAAKKRAAAKKPRMTGGPRRPRAR